MSQGCGGIVVLLAFVLVVGSIPVHGAFDASDPSIHRPQTASFSSVNWALDIPEAVDETGSGTASLDVGANLAQQHLTTRLQLHRKVVDRRFETAETDDQRFSILIDETERVGTRLSELKTQKREAVRAHARGRISDDQYLKRISAVSAQAGTLAGTIDLIESYGFDIRSAEVQRRANGLRDRATELQDPIGTRAAAATHGSVEPMQVYIRSTVDGVVLTTVIDGEFVRTAIRYDRRTFDGPTTDLRTSLDEIYRLYPAATQDPEVLEASGQRSEGFYYFLIAPSPDTTITTYLDNRNLTVFKEVYRLSVDQVALDSPLVASENDLRLAVRQTYIGGPMRLRVSGSSVSDPVIATVRLNGSVVGETDADGELWVVEPDPPYTITAARGGRNITMNVSVAESQ